MYEDKLIAVEMHDTNYDVGHNHSHVYNKIIRPWLNECSNMYHNAPQIVSIASNNHLYPVTQASRTHCSLSIWGH